MLLRHDVVAERHTGGARLGIAAGTCQHRFVPEPLADIRKRVGGHLAPALDLIDAMRENREPLCSARDGRVILEMIAGVFESHRLGGARVTLPLPERGNPLERL